jgi:hypothetical protein
MILLGQMPLGNFHFCILPPFPSSQYRAKVTFEQFQAPFASFAYFAVKSSLTAKHAKKGRRECKAVADLKAAG